MPNNATVVSAPFRFKVANVNRTSVDQNLKATFNLTLRSKQFDAITRTMSLTIDLDLSTSGGSGARRVHRGLHLDGEHGQVHDRHPGRRKEQPRELERLALPVQRPRRLEQQQRRRHRLLPRLHRRSGRRRQRLARPRQLGRATAAWAARTPGPSRCTGASTSAPRRSATPAASSSSMRSRRSTPSPSAWRRSNPELHFAHQVSLVDNRGIGNITNGEVADRAVVQINVLNSHGCARRTG